MLARTEAQVGKTGDAIAILDKLLALPNGMLVSVPLLKPGPAWDSVRHDPRFQSLLKKYGAAPASASSNVAAVRSSA